LERSQCALLTLVDNQNDTHASGAVDISTEQRLVQQLVEGNAIDCRRVAQLEQAGVPSLSQVLGDLEGVLLYISASPAKLSAGKFAELQQRLELSNLLFRVTVVSSQVRACENDIGARLGRNGT
jgi:hypothetical protein